MNFSGNTAPQIRKKFFFQLTTKIKPQEQHQQSDIIPKYPGQKIKYLLFYHSHTEMGGAGGHAL
jgi:hypothetical protein